MPAPPYRRPGQPACAYGPDPHPAELVPGTTETYVYAEHSGAWQQTCAAHAGWCHDDCWHAAHYPDLRARARVTYAGPVCPDCDRVAYAYQGGHEISCRFWAMTPPRRPA
jgi:hypothetical protein